MNTTLEKKTILPNGLLGLGFLPNFHAHPNDSQKEIYFDCRNPICNAGSGVCTTESGQIIWKRNSYIAKKGDILPDKSGDPIVNKSCPDCELETLVLF